MAPVRRYLVAGLLFWVPLGITVLIVKWMVDIMDQALVLLPPALLPENLIGFRIPGLGLVLVAAIVLVTGVIVTNLFGRQLVHLGERLLNRIPVVRAIYSSVKQVTETLFSSSGQSFRKVVLIPYPHPGTWSMGFLTGIGAGEVRDRLGRETYNVFIPTTPNPTSGFFLMVPREDVIELDMSVDEGLRMLLSVGVVQPKKKEAPAGGA